MSKYVLSFLLLLFVSGVLAQTKPAVVKRKPIAVKSKKSLVYLLNSESANGIKIGGKDVVKVYRGTFKQDYSTLSSDSANFYPQDNAFDAFGHVVINQGDTVHIYADKLNYNGNTKTAILTDNVRMVDKDAVLTTNHFTYNTATRIGVYTDGGKLVNRDNTLLSKNGYYFAFTRDSYFRYNVSLKTPDALIITDTMRYNTGTRISYFYGPTHIYSIKKEKDKDTLYTENGDYNTITEQAAFGKNNLYTSGTKSLKGDSLFYDKLKGYGRAVKHVTFIDKEQKAIIRGNLGTYFKADERALVTDDPVVIFITESKDTSKVDSAKAPTLKKNNGITMDEVIKKTIPGKVTDADLKKKGQALAMVDSLMKKNPVAAEAIKSAAANAKKTISAKNIDSLKGPNAKVLNIADSLMKKNPDLNKAIKSTAAATKKPATTKGKVTIQTSDTTIAKLPLKDTTRIKRDSVYASGDTIETQIFMYKDLKIYQEKQRLAHLIDTSAKKKKPKVIEKPSKFLTALQIGIPSDTTFRHRDFFGKAPVPPKKPVKPLSKKQLERDSLIKVQIADSTAAAKKLEPSDTARIRIIIVHHHAKIFKSDLQAKADSMFYSNADSTMRCYVNPIIWAQGSQLSGDTVYLQMKHKKLDNLTMFPNAFIANIEPPDSSHFNQLAGKKMRGYFKDDKLNRMVITGNAETIYFTRDSAKTTINEMERSLSNGITINLVNNQVTNMGFYSKPEHKFTPIAKVKEDDKILKSFIWKPKERPFSKESILPSFAKGKKVSASKAQSNGKDKNGKPIPKKPGTTTGAKGELIKDSGTPGIKSLKDSTLKTDTVKKPMMMMPVKKDSVIAKKPATPVDSKVKVDQ